MKYLLSLYILIASITSVLAADRADSTLMRYLRSEGLIAYPVRDVQVFNNGTDKFQAMFRDIDQAQRYVWVEYMILANDSIGRLTLSHLEQAARRGCEVRLIIDDYKDWERSYGFGTQHGQDSIRALGIDFVLFDRYHYPWLNHVCRDHRKIVVIDDTIGYIGGLNIADYYLNGSPKYGGWRDMHTRITGPAVEGLARLFSEHYHRYGGQGSHHFARYLYDHDYAQRRELSDVVFFERSRTTPQKQAETRHAIIAAIDAAQDTLRLVSPYFLPTHTVRQAIIRACDRGVYVEIMFSRVGDNAMLSYGNMNLARRLTRHGAHIYLYRGAFHHSKVITVDGQVCMVGSANLNSRSLKWDYEASAFFFNPVTTAQIDAIFRHDKQSCDTFSTTYYRQEFPLRVRTAGWLIDRFLTPIL